MKIALVCLYLFDSLSISSIRNSLKAKNNDVFLIFFKNHRPNRSRIPTQKEIELLVEKIKEITPEIIGISIVSPYIEIADMISKVIKDKLRTTVVYGGIHPTIMPEESLKYADMVCVGEGEDSFLELVERVKIGGRTDNIKGIWIKQNGQIIRNGYSIVNNLDSISFDCCDENRFYIENNKISRYAKDVIDIKDKFFAPIHVFVETYNIITSRGCPFKCSFCINGTIKNLSKDILKIRRRSVDHVIHELIVAKKILNIKTVFFWDNIFTINKNWISEFRDKYAKHIALPFMIMSHFHYIDKELLVELKEIGLKIIQIGIQSGSEETNRIYNRPFDRDKIIEKAKIIQESGVSPIYDLIIDNPFETADDKRKTFDLLLSLDRPFEISMRSLVFFPRYNITECAKKNKIFFDEQEKSEKSILIITNFKIFKRRNKQEVFWNSLYFLTPLAFLSKPTLKQLSRNPVLKKYPEILKIFSFLVYLFLTNIIFKNIRLKKFWLRPLPSNKNK